jgi:DNA-binding PadR family transcriptional regulator
MAATETRLLLLGTVMLFEPVNGYQLRRELLSWQVEDWAHVNPGSIYSGLTTLTKQGNLERHDLVDGTRDVAVYTSTTEGRLEFARLWRSAVETVDVLSPLPFHTAMALMPLVGRESVRDALQARLAATDAKAREQLSQQPPAGAVPPHVRALADLWMGLGQTEREWLVNLIARVDRGELELQGEESSWMPPSDDPGWQMANDRERYLRLIGGH